MTVCVLSRGGQGTFDKIIANVRNVAGMCNIAVGGNFDEQSVDSYPALLDFLKEQDFADSLVKVAFKPIISTEPKLSTDGLIPLTAVDSSGKALGGGCMTAAVRWWCRLTVRLLSFPRREDVVSP